MSQVTPRLTLITAAHAWDTAPLGGGGGVGKRWGCHRSRSSPPRRALRTTSGRKARGCRPGRKCGGGCAEGAWWRSGECRAPPGDTPLSHPRLPTPTRRRQPGWGNPGRRLTSRGTDPPRHRGVGPRAPHPPPALPRPAEGANGLPWGAAKICGSELRSAGLQWGAGGAGGRGICGAASPRSAGRLLPTHPPPALRARSGPSGACPRCSCRGVVRGCARSVGVSAPHPYPKTRVLLVSPSTAREQVDRACWSTLLAARVPSPYYTGLF